MHSKAHTCQYRISSSALVNDIQSRNEQFMRLFAAGDTNGISQLFTTDCKLLAPQQDTLSGQGGD